MQSFIDYQFVNPDESNALGEGMQAADLERDSVVDRFKVARDDEMIGSLSFDILECGQGTLRLVQPSRRGYERYYLAVAIVVVAFALPFLLGLLPWQILVRGGSRGLPPETVGWSILYFLLVLGAVVVWSLSDAPRLAERRPRAAKPAVVLEAEFGKKPNMPPRIRVRAGDDTFWLTVYAKPAALRSGLALAGQTTWEHTSDG